MSKSVESRLVVYGRCYTHSSIQIVTYSDVKSNLQLIGPSNEVPQYIIKLMTELKEKEAKTLLFSSLSVHIFR